MCSAFLPNICYRSARPILVYILFVLVSLTAAILVANLWNPGDIKVYLDAASRLRQNQNPYVFPFDGEITAFQYLPWSLWPFVPLTFLPFTLAWPIYLSINLLILAFSCYALVRIYDDNNEHLLFSFTAAVILSLLLLATGQATGLVLLAAILVLIAIRYNYSGLLVLAFAFLVFKPQLVLIFAPAAFLRMNRKGKVYSLIGLCIVILISFLQRPGWPLELVNVLNQIWVLDDKNSHTFRPIVFSHLFGIPYGLGSLLSSVVLLVISAILLYRLRNLPIISWLALSLGLSLVSAPYLFSYDLPLLLPLIALNEKENPHLRLPFWGVTILVLFFGLYSASAAMIPPLVVGIQFYNRYFFGRDKSLIFSNL